MYTCALVPRRAMRRRRRPGPTAAMQPLDPLRSVHARELRVAGGQRGCSEDQALTRPLHAWRPA